MRSPLMSKTELDLFSLKDPSKLESKKHLSAILGYCLHSIIDNFKIILQFSGEIKRDHIKYEVNKGRIVSSARCYLLIVRRNEERGWERPRTYWGLA